VIFIGTENVIILAFPELTAPGPAVHASGASISMKRFGSFVLLNFLLFSFIPGCSRPPVPDEHIKVVMKKYAIEPAIIRVKSGEIVELEVSTVDVQHGFEVAQLGIREAVQPGRPAVFTFKAPGKGEYLVTCSILCGAHHDDMQAKLVVE
jgi:heme/copper-type cytochrome/quinol oxidase subunit 2